MRKLIGQKGIGGNRESWFYLEKDADGEFYYVHEWGNMSHNLSTDSGERRMPLNEAADEAYYQEALSLSQNWPG